MRGFDYTNATGIDNFIKKIRELYRVEWFLNQTASWNTNYKPIFTETITRRGFAFAFNMLQGSKLFTER
jgi:hypothetical protein